MKHLTCYQGKTGYRIVRRGQEYSTPGWSLIKSVMPLGLWALWYVVYPIRDSNGGWKYKKEVLKKIESQYSIIRTVHGSDPKHIAAYPGIKGGIVCAAGSVVLWSVYHKQGAYIGDVSYTWGLICRGLTDIQPADPKGSVCNIGWNATQQKWYGWSHRAICGFGVGFKIEEDTAGREYTKFPIGYRLKSLQGCKDMAAAFALAVS